MRDTNHRASWMWPSRWSEWRLMGPPHAPAPSHYPPELAGLQDSESRCSSSSLPTSGGGTSTGGEAILRGWRRVHASLIQATRKSGGVRLPRHDESCSTGGRSGEGQRGAERLPACPRVCAGRTPPGGAMQCGADAGVRGGVPSHRLARQWWVGKNARR